MVSTFLASTFLASTFVAPALLVPLLATEVRAQAGPFLYVPNTTGNNVSVVDTSTNLAGSPILTSSHSFFPAVKGDGSLLYVSNYLNNTVTPINTATNTAGTPIPVGVNPYGIAMTPDGTTVYVANNSGNTVSVISTATNTVTAIIAGFSAPTDVVVSPDGKTAYVTDQTIGKVTPINIATNTTGTPITVGTAPFFLAVSPDGKTVFVANSGNGTVSVINTATNAVTATVTVGGTPTDVVVTPDGKTAYVTNQSTVTPIDTATNTAGTPISVGVGTSPFGLTVSPDGKTLYVEVANGGGSVATINTATNTAGSSIVTSGGQFPGICSNGNALLASGLTFVARTSGALACTLASGPTGAPGPVFTGGTMQFAGAGIASALPISLQGAGGTFDTNGNNAVLSGMISGSGSLTKIGIGTLTLSGSSTYTGGTFVNAGTLQAGAVNALSPLSAFKVAAGAFLDLNSFNQTIGSLAGAGNVTLGAATLTTGNDGTSTTFSGAILGSGGLIKTGGGTFTLAGTSAYTGATAVNAGTLQINGSIATSSLTSVNNGGTLIGTGTVGPTLINSGGTFAPGSGSPGTAMTVAGNLAFQSGALYLVQVNPATSTFATASGTAALAGAVGANFAAGSYIAKQYDILHSAGLGGTMFSALLVTNLPTSFAAGLVYTPTDVLLNLTANLGSGGGLNGNQQSAANAINNAFNSGATLPPGFLTVFGLGGGALANALSQLDGEAAADAEQGAFKLMDQFLALMLDPFVDGRSPTGWPSGGAASGFAPDRQAGFPPDVALAYGSVLKAPPNPAGFDQRWSAWGSGFGGNNKTNGDPVVGSSTVAARDYGFAGGLDYHVSADTVAGFALSGGGTNWELAQGLGGGRSDAFQAGLYGTTRSGPAYVAAALAFANHWMTIGRVAFGGDQLAAKFNGQSYAGRLEAGYRYAAAPGLGVTPYAAVQVQSFDTPAYRETDLTGGGFGLSYSAMTATDTRSEIGGRFDHLTLLGAMPLTLRARAAWAHDWVTNPALGAVFQSLPGASFTVDGAAPPKDSALASAGAELHLTRALSLAAQFDGEFAAGSQIYAGTGALRYVW